MASRMRSNGNSCGGTVLTLPRAISSVHLFPQTKFQKCCGKLSSSINGMQNCGDRRRSRPKQAFEWIESKKLAPEPEFFVWDGLARHVDFEVLHFRSGKAVGLFMKQ